MMPLKRCQNDGESGWKWGDEGKCYTGSNAKQKAIEQAIAMGEGDKLSSTILDELTQENKMKLFDFLTGKSDEEDLDDALKRHFSLDALNDASDEEIRNLFGNMSVRYLRLRERAEELLGVLRARGADLPENTALFDAIESSDTEKSDTKKSDGTDNTDETADEDEADEGAAQKSHDESAEDELEELRKHALSGRGDPNAMVVFVGASPSKLDLIRKKVYSGPVGKTLQDTYLSQLDTESVYLTNAVPVFLSDDEGNPREPDAEEVAKWAPILQEELEKVNPRFIVALGKTARDALGDRVDEFVPHPRAVNIYGDSGEVARKLSRLNEDVQKSAGQDTPSMEFDIMKSDDERQIVYGVVYEPNTADTDGNWTTPEEIEKAAHYFMKNFRLIGHEHQEVVEDAYPVESYIAPVDFELAGQPVSKGTWVAAIKIDDKERWSMIKSGDYTGFSIGAKAKIDPEKRIDDE